MCSHAIASAALLCGRTGDPPPMAGPLPVLVDGWRFDQFVLV
jgi:hypothetical protein